MFVDSSLLTSMVNNGAASPAHDVLNQTGHGVVQCDPGLLRPWIDGDGQRYCDVRTGKPRRDDSGKIIRNARGVAEPEIDVVNLNDLMAAHIVPSYVNNATALPKDVWEMIDRDVLQPQLETLQAWSDLRAANTFGGFDGMAITSLIRDTRTSSGSATIDMDGLTEPRGDITTYTPDLLPLPITHSGFFIGERKLASSRNSGVPMDTTLAQDASRRVSESIEDQVIGRIDLSSFTHTGSGTFTNSGIFGYITHPDRITKTLTATSALATPLEIVDDVIAMVRLASAQNFNGPFVLYFSPDWETLLDSDYVVGTFAQGYTTVNQTVRERIERIARISSVRVLDRLNTDNSAVLVQMTSQTVRAVSGLEMTTVQWDTRGGQQHNFQVMAIQVPDLRSQFIGTSTTVTDRICGVVHGSV